MHPTIFCIVYFKSVKYTKKTLFFRILESENKAHQRVRKETHIYKLRHLGWVMILFPLFFENVLFLSLSFHLLSISIIKFMSILSPC